MISVIIVSYRTGPLVFRSLDSALAQQGVGDVVIVDNGNPPDTTSALEERVRRDSRIKLLTGHGNIGFAAACNKGRLAAKGDHLLFLNPDALLPEGAAAWLLAEGKASGTSNWVVGPKLVDPDGTEQQGSRREILTPWNAVVEATRLYKLAPNHPSFQRFNTHEEASPNSPSVVPCLSGAVFLLPAPTYDAVGGFDERFFLHVEDIDFFLRLGKIKARILYVPMVEVTHYKSSSRADRLKVERLKKQSLNLYFATHFDGVYPKGFLTGLRVMLWTSFTGRFLKIRLGRAVRLTGFTLKHGPMAALRALRMQPKFDLGQTRQKAA